MKTLIKVGTTIGIVIVGLAIIGVIITAAVNIVVGLFTAIAGGCVLLACWAILKGLIGRFGQTRTPQSNP